MIKGIICFNKVNGEQILFAAKTLLAWAQKHQIPIFFQPDFPDSSFPRKSLSEALSLTDTAVSLGGDGTFLAMARILHSTQHTLMGVSLGSFGFLTEMNLSEMTSFLDIHHTGDSQLRMRPYIRVDLHNGSKKPETFYGINDAVITKASLSRIIGVDIWVDHQHIGMVRGDGVIVATPIGSTGYSLAAGGPIVYPMLEALSITPISPHTLTYRPIMAPMNKIIELHVEKEARSEIFLSIDGQQGHLISPGSKVTVTQDTHQLKVLANPNRTYWEVLRTKMKLGTR